MRSLVALLFALCVAHYPSVAHAQSMPASAPASAPAVPPPLHLLSGASCTTGAGNALTLPSGFFLAEPTFVVLGLEVQRLQEAETRLTKENEVLKLGLAPTRLTVKLAVALSVISFAAGAISVYEITR